MGSLIQRCVVVVAAGALVACTSLQPLAERSGAGEDRARRQAAAMSIGDTVRVNLKQGEPFDLVVTGLTPDRVIGNQNGASREILVADVASFEQWRVDMLRTSWLVLGIMLLGLAQYAKGAAKLSNP